MGADTTAAGHDAAVDAWRRWRQEREAELAAPHGWLSLVALHWLDAEPRRFPDVPGTWRATDAHVRVDASAEDGLVHEGEPVDGSRLLVPVDGAPGELVAAGRRRIEVIRRGAAHALRPRDPDAPSRTGFAGVPTYPYDAAWVVPGAFEPFATPRPVVVGAVVEGLAHRYAAIGRIRFVLGGREHALTAYPASDPPGGLLVQFRDATTGVTTHASSRAVALGPPAPDGRVAVDFNRAVNLPCAFTDHATCPLAPPENTIGVPVEAGERDPRWR